MEDQISNLEPFNESNYKILFDIHLTMIDGKVSNAIASTSSMTCNIC